MIRRKDLNESILLMSHGVSIRLVTNSPEAIEAAMPELKANLPGCVFTKANGPCDHEFAYYWNPGRLDAVYKNGEKIATRRRRDYAIPLLGSQVRLTVAEYSPEHTFIHAGVVSIKGRAVIIPAKSYQGKTTLTAELVRRGALYYSDEYAVIDKRGRVHPFPKDLSMRGIIDDRRQVDMPVEDFGGRAGKRPIPAGLILFTEYVENARWRPRRLTPGQAFLELVSHTVPIRQNTELSMQTLGKLIQTAELFKTKRGEAATTAGLIFDLASSDCVRR